MPGQLFSGTLGLLRPSSAATKEKQEAERREREGDRGDEPRRTPMERPKIVWFKPTDKRVPLIAIPTEQAPLDFVQNSEAYVDKLFVACIKRHVRVNKTLRRFITDPNCHSQSALCTLSAHWSRNWVPLVTSRLKPVLFSKTATSLPRSSPTTFSNVCRPFHGRE